MLMTAKKSVKTGLVASAVVSSCRLTLKTNFRALLNHLGCYAATILNSVRLTYLCVNATIIATMLIKTGMASQDYGGSSPGPLFKSSAMRF